MNNAILTRGVKSIRELRLETTELLGRLHLMGLRTFEAQLDDVAADIFKCVKQGFWGAVDNQDLTLLNYRANFWIGCNQNRLTVEDLLKRDLRSFHDCVAIFKAYSHMSPEIACEQLKVSKELYNKVHLGQYSMIPYEERESIRNSVFAFLSLFPEGHSAQDVRVPRSKFQGLQQLWETTKEIIEKGQKLNCDFVACYSGLAKPYRTELKTGKTEPQNLTLAYLNMRHALETVF